jgi:predicted dienelactone hydrolase
MKSKKENVEMANVQRPLELLLKFIKILFKGIVGLIGLIIVVILICLGLLWLEHNKSVILPSPTGQFAVGRTTYYWIDNTRTDSLAPVRNQKRELLIWIWYPADKGGKVKLSEYVSKPWRIAIENYQGILLTKFLKTDLSKVYAHNIGDANVSTRMQSYPVIILRSGVGSLASDYTTLAEDLASHGYIVVGADAPYSTVIVVFPDGRVITRPEANDVENMPAEKQNIFANKLLNLWTADTRFILDKLQQLNAESASDKFSGRLNLQAVGIMGHSFGGATAAQFCHDDNRCKAGINMDGIPFGNVVHEGLRQPFLFMTSDSGAELDSVSLSNIQSIYNLFPVKSRLWVKIQGAQHFNFSDQALLNDPHIGKFTGMLGPIDGRRGLAIAAGYTRTFFDVYLKNESDYLLKNPSSVYPEIQFERK